MSADPITVLTLLAISGHGVTPQVSDTLACAVRTRVETLLTARRGPLPSEDIDRIEFDVATELMVLGLAIVARLPAPAADLAAVVDALSTAAVELQRMADERRVV